MREVYSFKNTDLVACQNKRLDAQKLSLLELLIAAKNTSANHFIRHQNLHIASQDL